MVLHGSEKVVVEDVWGIGKAIDVNFKGDNHNMFSVLSRVGKEKRELKNNEVEGERRSGGES